MQQLVMLDVQSHPRTKEPISERSKISLTKQRNIFEELNIYSLLLKDKQLRKKNIHVYYKNIVTDKNRRAIWVKTSKIKSLTSEWTTNIVPKIPVYIADLIRLCRADISHHKHWAVFPFPLSVRPKYQQDHDPVSTAISRVNIRSDSTGWYC